MGDELSELIKIPTTTKYLNELTPHPDNYNSHPKEQISQLAESLTTFGQFKNIVAWTCPENMTTPDGIELHEGLCYILAGHGLWLAAMEAGIDELEVKDYTGLSYEMALTLLMTDNAAPLGSQPIREKLIAMLERTKQVRIDKPDLAAMLEGLKQRAGINGLSSNSNGASGAPQQIPEQFMILIECQTEFEQTELLERFTAEGIQCKALIS